MSVEDPGQASRVGKGSHRTLPVNQPAQPLPPPESARNPHIPPMMGAMAHPHQDHPADPRLDAPTTPSRRDPGSPPTRFLALLATTLVVALVVWMQSAARNAPPIASTTSVDAPGAVVTLIARYSVGAARLFPASAGAGLEDSLVRQMETSFASNPADSLRVAIVKAELLKPADALAHLEQLLQREDLPEPVRADAHLLQRLYAEGPDALSPDEQQALRDTHHWFADLALIHALPDSHPTRIDILASADRTALTLFAAIALGAGLSLLGLILFIILLTQRLSGKLPSTYRPPSRGGSVYLEAFAIFLAGFIAISFISDPLEAILGFPPMPALVWLLALVPFYPLLRGQPWSKHRYAMGLHTGKGVLREIAAGILGYIAGLPIFLLGILGTLLLAFAQTWLAESSGQPAGPPPSHPIVDSVGAGGILQTLILYSMVAIWAPFVEECMFRGAFYHHLRARFRPLVSAIAVAFVFAVIHPPGIIAVPALMSLAVVFALIREWRGSLIGCMVAHALHNGALITMLLLMIA